jgi:hypothetical protein
MIHDDEDFVSVNSVRFDKPCFVLAKAILRASEGYWEPSIVQASEIMDKIEPAILRSISAENEMLRSALERLYRNGQKQGWNDGYEEDMEAAKAALERP